MSVAVLRIVPAVRIDVHLLHALDLAGLYETAELGDGLPLLLLHNCQFSAHSLISLLCAPQTCRHGDHVHGRGHGHGHHHGLHEIQIRREREQVRQPFCMSVEWTTLEVLSAIIEGGQQARWTYGVSWRVSSRREEVAKFKLQVQAGATR